MPTPETDASERRSSKRVYMDATVSTAGNWHSSARAMTYTGGRYVELWGDDETHFTYPRHAVESISTVIEGGHPGVHDRPARVSGARRATVDIDGTYDSVAVLPDSWVRIITPHGGAGWLVQDYPPEMIMQIEWDSPDTET